MGKRQQSSIFFALDELIPVDHPYRKLDQLLSFSEISKPYYSLYSMNGRKEKGVEFGLRALVLQFIEDLSDREMERFLQENLAGKWFCELGIGEKSPDHSYFGDFRKRLGTERLMNIFSHVRGSLREMGLIKEIFTFVDASQLVSKLTTWDDRDKAIKLGLEKFNNKTAGKVATDKQARFGCKGQNKYWYGYKEHASVDMQSGLINKIAATSADVTDAQGLQHVCPKDGAVYGDKGYCVNPAKITLKRKGCHDATIKKANMKDKNRHKDRWLSSIRSPYERVFAHRNKQVRYRGLKKVQFQVGIRALVFNLKRLMALGIERIALLPA
jgi:transposase, IS5 family